MKTPIRAAAALAALLALSAVLPACFPKTRLYELGNDGGMVFLVNPPDAEVLLDGTVQGKASDFTEDRYLKVPAGTHRLELRRAGFESYGREVYVSRSLMRIEATLVATPVPPSAPSPAPYR